MRAKPVTLRLRLTLAVVAILAGAAVLLGWVTITTARASMQAQVDNQLRGVTDRPKGPSKHGSRPPPPSEGGEQYRSYAELSFGPDGGLERAEPAGFPDDPLPLPALTTFTDPRAQSLIRGIQTLSSENGSVSYRALARTEPDGGHQVVAWSLEEVEAATSGVRRAVLGTVAAVLILGVASSWWVIRRGLRPVDRMIDTASAIAAGDLTKRVDHHEGSTELGRLAAALDEMLGQVEASQARLKRFIGDASHELRTPVTAIQGYAELYRNGGIAPGPDLDRAMDRIQSESIRMGRLVQDMLLLARLDQQQPLDQERVDLTTLAADAVADFQAIDPRRPITCELNGPAVVVGDEPRLRQVVANLLANARVHTPPGTPVEVGVANEAGEVRLTVADRGPGIPRGDEVRVFERFYRGDPSRSRDTGGTGLGLSIVGAIVAAHGGTVEVGRGTETGAVFTIRLLAAAD